MAALELEDWPEGRPLALAGSAANLRLPLALRNTGSGPQHLAEASLAKVVLTGGGPALRGAPVPVLMNLAGDSVTRTRLRLKLDPATPPGRYEGELALGDLRRPVVIDILPEPKLEIRPTPVMVDAALGPAQTFAAAVENQGNVPLTIDATGSYPLGEEVAVPTADDSPALFLGLPSSFETRRPSLIRAGVVELRQPAGPRWLPPGETQVLSLELALPDGLAPGARYHAFIPLYANDLHLVIVTATKSAAKPPPTKAPPRSSKGTAA